MVMRKLLDAGGVLDAHGKRHRTGLELLEVQPAGGRVMDAAAYLRGHGSAAIGRDSG